MHRRRALGQTLGGDSVGNAGGHMGQAGSVRKRAPRPPSCAGRYSPRTGTCVLNQRSPSATASHVESRTQSTASMPYAASSSCKWSSSSLTLRCPPPKVFGRGGGPRKGGGDETRFYGKHARGDPALGAGRPRLGRKFRREPQSVYRAAGDGRYSPTDRSGPDHAR